MQERNTNVELVGSIRISGPIIFQQTLFLLRLNERLNKRVGGLRVQWQGVFETLQLRRLLKVDALQAATFSMEIVLDLEGCTKIWKYILCILTSLRHFPGRNAEYVGYQTKYFITKSSTKLYTNILSCSRAVLTRYQANVVWLLNLFWNISAFQLHKPGPSRHPVPCIAWESDSFQTP